MGYIKKYCVGTCRLRVWSKLIRYDSLGDSLLELGLEDTKQQINKTKKKPTQSNQNPEK